MITTNSLSSAASEQIVPSDVAVDGRKPRAVDRLRNASRRSQSAAEKKKVDVYKFIQSEY